MRDLVVTLNSPDGNQELPPTDVMGVLADTTESLMVSGTQNININNGSSRDIAADNDSNMKATEQAVPTEGKDLPTTMKLAESKPTNKEQALSIVGVDLYFLKETKLTNGIYTRFSLGYWVLATNTMSHGQGGVDLVYRELPYWQVELSVLHGPNVISAVIVSGNLQYGIVCLYIPPADTTTSMHITTGIKYDIIISGLKYEDMCRKK